MILFFSNVNVILPKFSRKLVYRKRYLFILKNAVSFSLLFGKLLRNEKNAKKSQSLTKIFYLLIWGSPSNRTCFPFYANGIIYIRALVHRYI